MSTSTTLKLNMYLAVAFGPDVSTGEVTFTDGGSVVLVRAPSIKTAGTTAMGYLIWEESEFISNGNTVQIVSLELPSEGEEELENSYLTILEYAPPAPVVIRTPVFEGVFKRTSGPHTIQFVELLKKEIVKGIFNTGDPTNGVDLMRKVASTMLPHWGLLRGALVSKLNEGNMPIELVDKISNDLDRVPYGTNAYTWELVYVPEEGVGYFRMGAYLPV